jgi:adenylyltransferase/sulfurtransferase
MPPPFQDHEVLRYTRQIALAEVGITGQSRLKSSSVLIVGLGGLGTPVATYLAGAGVGHLGLVDFDIIDVSNLQRQVLFQERDINLPKAAVAAERLACLNPFLRFSAYDERLTYASARNIIPRYNVVVDCTDNPESRYMINDAAFFAKRPVVSGAIAGLDGQVSVYNHDNGPCYRCLHPRNASNSPVNACTSGGVLGATCGIIGSMMALETIKIIVGFGSTLSGRLSCFSGYSGDWSAYKIQRAEECVLCTSAYSEVEWLQRECGEKSGHSDLANMEITPKALVAADPQNFEFLDVRDEKFLPPLPLDCRPIRIPFSQLVGRKDSIPADRPIIVFCNTGSLSIEATRILREVGFARAWSLRGGVIGCQDIRPI